MSGGQIAALIFAILLLLPGGCFLIMGIGISLETHPDRIDQDLGPVALGVAFMILSLTGFLFWLAFRHRRTAVPPLTPPPSPGDSQNG
jgi:hypothetical protein